MGPSMAATEVFHRAEGCGRCRAGASTGCRFPAFTRPVARRTREAPSQARLAGTPRWSCSRTSARAWSGCWTRPPPAPFADQGRWKGAISRYPTREEFLQTNPLKTAFRVVAMTFPLVLVGRLLGGNGGMFIALVFAVVM